MAKLPPGFSLQAFPIEQAISEGRMEDAKTLIVKILLAGKADTVVQKIAAQLIKPPKRKRGRRKTLPHHWHNIGEGFHWLRDKGTKYEDALSQLADKFGYSEGHIRNSIAEYDAAKAAHDEATAE